MEELQLDLAALPSANNPTALEGAKEPASNSSNSSSHKDSVQSQRCGEGTEVVGTTRPSEECDETSSTSDSNPTFDVLRFKNNFLKMVEELRLRRTLNSENEAQIEKLLMEKHELSHKLDEAVSCSSKLAESHSCQLQDLTKKHQEELQQYSNAQAKHLASQESWERELKALKDEMKALHLTKHVLEKKVQEQDRQIQLQGSFRENYQAKITQLEEKCSTLQKLAEDTTEHVTGLETNVKQAQDLHQTLDCVNQHQTCELADVKKQLEACRQELVESRAGRAANAGNHSNRDSENDGTKQRDTEQDLKMQVELCRHVQSQLQSLRREHQEVILRLKEAHALIERHVESAENVKEKLEHLKSQVEKLEERCSLAEEELQRKEEKHVREKETWDQKMADRDHRLSTLQTDYKLLQDSYECLEAAKLTMKHEHEAEAEDLRSKCAEVEKERASLEQAEMDLKCSESELKEQVAKLQCALDQSELQLAKHEGELQEATDLLAKLKTSDFAGGGNKTVVIGATCGGGTGPSHKAEFSPEVISSASGDETPDLHTQKINEAAVTTNQAVILPSPPSTSTAFTEPTPLTELPLPPATPPEPSNSAETEVEVTMNPSPLDNAKPDPTTTSGAVSSPSKGAPEVMNLDKDSKPEPPNQTNGDDPPQTSTPEEQDPNLDPPETKRARLMDQTPVEDITPMNPMGSSGGEKMEEGAGGDKEICKGAGAAETVQQSPKNAMETPKNGQETGGGGAASAKEGGAGGESAEEGGASEEEKDLESEGILFSPESRDSMFSTQINKQIRRVEMFLKMDRLRKRK